ncbi:MAG: hypothetical protein ABIP78_02395 [Pyrinomonadaceae bacterium]
MAQVDAKKTYYEELDAAVRQNLKNRFDWWLRTFGVTKKEYCHGWDEEGYENVWVFKYREHRIFGFLCHPDPAEPGFLLCVLCSYTIKEGWEADKTLKDLIAAFAVNKKKLTAAIAVHEAASCPHRNEEHKTNEATTTTSTLD